MCRNYKKCIKTNIKKNIKKHQLRPEFVMWLKQTDLKNLTTWLWGAAAGIPRACWGQVFSSK